MSFLVWMKMCFMSIASFNEHLNSWIEYTKNYEQLKITKPQYIYNTTEKSPKTRISGSFRYRLTCTHHSNHCKFDLYVYVWKHNVCKNSDSFVPRFKIINMDSSYDRTEYFFLIWKRIVSIIKQNWEKGKYEPFILSSSVN